MHTKCVSGYEQMDEVNCVAFRIFERDNLRTIENWRLSLENVAVALTYICTKIEFYRRDVEMCVFFFFFEQKKIHDDDEKCKYFLRKTKAMTIEPFGTASFIVEKKKNGMKKGYIE